MGEKEEEEERGECRIAGDIRQAHFRGGTHILGGESKVKESLDGGEFIKGFFSSFNFGIYTDATLIFLVIVITAYFFVVLHLSTLDWVVNLNYITWPAGNLRPVCTIESIQLIFCRKMREELLNFQILN